MPLPPKPTEDDLDDWGDDEWEDPADWDVDDDDGEPPLADPPSLLDDDAEEPLEPPMATEEEGDDPFFDEEPDSEDPQLALLDDLDEPPWMDEPIALPWSCTARVDGEEVPAILDPTRPTSTLARPGTAPSTRSVHLTLGPLALTHTLSIVDGPALLLTVGRDVLANRVLVSSR